MNDKHADSALEALLRDMGAEDIELLEPPDKVWDGIEAAIRIHEDASASVVPLHSRKRLARRVLVRVAAALIVVVIGIGAFLALSGDGGQVIASATLAYDPATFDALGSDASGGANLVSDDGKLTVDIVGSRPALPRRRRRSRGVAHPTRRRQRRRSGLHRVGRPCRPREPGRSTES